MKSDFVKKGTERAPHRSLFNAAGYTDEELERPLIGVVNSFNEIVPGHMNLDKICEAVKKGIYLAGGVPVEIPAIAVCDGIAGKRLPVFNCLPYQLGPGSSGK